MTAAVLDVLLRGVYDAVLDVGEGHLDADTEGLYDPDAFGIALVDMDGHTHTIGDTTSRFPLQSMSKAFAFDLALSVCGPKAVFERVGVEPSGEPYNSIELDAQGRAPNPLVNSGAITITSMLREKWGVAPHAAAQRIQGEFSRFAGEELDFDMGIYEKMVDTAHHNLAIANLLRSTGHIADAAGTPTPISNSAPSA
jgi:glutaminase